MNTRTLVAIFFSIGFFSCASPSNHGSSGAKRDSAGALAVNRDRPGPEEPLPLFKTLDTVLSFAGVWVNEIYFDSIEKNRSPRLDQGIVESCIIIPDSTLEATNMVGGFHDGGGTMVIVKDGDRYQFYDPGLTIPLDTIEPLSATRLRIGRQYFRPLKHPDRDKNDWGILEERLFSGRYQQQNGKEVLFGTDGHITGLDIVSYYEPTIDYSDRADLHMDLISLGQSHTKLDEYCFRFSRDTLLIYTIDCLHYDANEHGCDSARFGQLMWKLQRMPG